MKRFSLVFIVFLILFVSGISQAQTATPTPPEVEVDDDVVKINSSVVQVDAIVTDKNGTPVTDLKREDFEILQDGKVKDISNFSFVNTVLPNTKPETKEKNKSNIPIPPTRQRSNNTGRVITFIIDDGNCSASTVGMIAAREGLEDFVNKQMFPNDLVAIYKTRSGSSLLQQYTSDKSLLLKVIKKIRWYPSIGCSNNGSFFSAARQFQNITIQQDPNTPSGTDGTDVFQQEQERKQKESNEDTNRDNQLVGTLGVIRYIVRGLDKVPGRKVVFLMSDGFPSLGEDGNPRQVQDSLRNLTDEANRAAVVLNTVDVRGVIAPSMITAEDDIKTTKDFAVDKSSSEEVSESRRSQYRDSQNAMAFLADETGGRFYRGNNNLEVLLDRAMKIEKGYYLLGYEPDDETFKGKNFHRIEIKLKRPDLQIYSRAGFIGREDSKRNTGKKDGRAELYEAIVAPLPQAGLDIRLTAFYANSAEKGNFVRSLIYIDGKDIEFIDDKDGMKKAVFDVIAVTMNQKNDIVDEFNRTHTIKIKKEAIPFIRENGLAYTTDVNVKKSGVYNVRVAMRDVNNNLVGSATQKIEIPKFKKDNFYLSELVLSSADQGKKYDSSVSIDPEQAISLIGSKGAAEIRSFTAGTKLKYNFTLYNPKLDSQTKEPNISVIMNLYKDGELIFEGKPKAVRLGLQSDWSRVKVSDQIQLGERTEVGDYVLQIIAKDLIGNELTSQFIDFEVIN